MAQMHAIADSNKGAHDTATATRQMPCSSQECRVSTVADNASESCGTQVLRDGDEMPIIMIEGGRVIGLAS